MGAGDAAPKAIVAHALDVLLRMLHPFVPFITEQIWSQLNATVAHRGPGDAPAEPMLAAAAWPSAESQWIHEPLEGRFAAVQELIGGIREVRSRHNVPTSKAVAVTVVADEDRGREIAGSAAVIAALAAVGELRVDAAATASGADAIVLAGGLQALVHDVIDRDAERARLTAQAETLRKGIRGIDAKLANDNFVSRAPPEVVQRERDRLVRLQGELAAVETSLETLK